MLSVRPEPLNEGDILFFFNLESRHLCQRTSYYAMYENFIDENFNKNVLKRKVLFRPAKK